MKTLGDVINVWVDTTYNLKQDYAKRKTAYFSIIQIAFLVYSVNLNI